MIYHLPLTSSVIGSFWDPVVWEFKSSLRTGAVAGHVKAGFSTGTNGGAASPISTLKTVLMDGLSYGLGWQHANPNSSTHLA